MNLSAHRKNIFATRAAIALSLVAPLLAYCLRATNVRETAERPEQPKSAPTAGAPSSISTSSPAMFPDEPPTQNLAGSEAAAPVLSQAAPPPPERQPSRQRSPPLGSHGNPIVLSRLPVAPAASAAPAPIVGSTPVARIPAGAAGSGSPVAIPIANNGNAPQILRSPNNGPVAGGAPAAGNVAGPSGVVAGRATPNAGVPGGAAAGVVAPGAGNGTTPAVLAAPMYNGLPFPTLPKVPVKPAVVVADRDLEQLLTEAWGLIERGDYEPGRARLEKARKRNRDDPRAEFSLGLLDGLVSGDWGAAEKHFEASLHRDPKNVPSLNNLAIAQLHNKRETEAVKHWKAIVDQQAATGEVVQNLGRVRQLVKEGAIRKNAALVKSVEELYAKAAIATALSAQPQGNFRAMAMQLPDGRCVGWHNMRKMEDSTPIAVATASARQKPPRSTGPAPGTSNPGIVKPGSAPGPADQRTRPSGPIQPGMISQQSLPSNVAGYPVPGQAAFYGGRPGYMNAPR